MEEEIFRPEFHPHTLKLKRSYKFYELNAMAADYCAVCGRSVDGFVYYCEELELCMHPRCHSLPSKFKFYHLEFMLRDQVSSVCLRCNKRRHEGTSISGFQDNFMSLRSYVSKCNKYNFHVLCAFQLIFSQEYKGVPLGNNLEQSIRGFVEIYLGDILKRQRRRNIVMSFVITNLVLELVSALLDQVSSANKTQFALFGMLISFVAMLICILEFIYQVLTQKPIWRWSSTLPFPWYYYRDEGWKPFGTFKDIVGLICALCQCVVATVSYCYFRRHADNPIKISIFPIIFAFGILFSQILKNLDAEKPSDENLIRVLGSSATSIVDDP
ncbi:hypothetical protein EZV62_025617 [Acer yangbiense]|uniref:DC1 domain-containing protein n=1 Tax=Acer yangbiense TaxID=1000413 RepID=A0A5C7GZN0_9ROSI|nr:hypothetical protein EZV62_025617 [Acer yangbiense]